MTKKLIASNLVTGEMNNIPGFSKAANILKNNCFQTNDHINLKIPGVKGKERKRRAIKLMQKHERKDNRRIKPSCFQLYTCQFHLYFLPGFCHGGCIWTGL